MSTTTSKLYQKLLASPTLPAGLQQRIFNWASSAKDVETLATLAEHPNLDRSVDAQLGTLNDSRIRRSWIARTWRTADEVDDAIRTDTRAAVLGVLAARRDLTVDQYAAIAAKAHRAVCEILLVNPSVPLDILHVAMQRWASQSSKASYKSKSDMRQVLANRPQLHETFALHGDDPLLFDAVMSSPLSAPAFDRLADVGVVEVLAATVERANYEEKHAREKAYASARQLGDNTALPAATRQRLLELLRGTRERDANDENRRIEAVKSLSGTGTARAATLVGRAEAAASYDELAEIARKASKANDFAAVAAALMNPLATVELTIELGGRLQSGVLDRILETRVGDRSFVATVCVHYGHHVKDKLLEATGDPDDMMRRIVAEARRLGKALPYQLARSKYLTADVVIQLPLSYLAGTSLDERTVAVIAEALERALGDDEDLWTTFERLSSEFDQSLADLFELCGLLNVDADPADDSDEVPTVDADGDDIGQLQLL